MAKHSQRNSSKTCTETNCIGRHQHESNFSCQQVMPFYSDGVPQTYVSAVSIFNINRECISKQLRTYRPCNLLFQTLHLSITSLQGTHMSKNNHCDVTRSKLSPADLNSTPNCLQQISNSWYFRGPGLVNIWRNRICTLFLVPDIMPN